MLRTIHRAMKRNGVIVALFAFLTLGAVFSHSLGCHQHGAIAVAHFHGQDEIAAFDHGLHHEHPGDSSAPQSSCTNECCAPGCLSLIDNTGGEASRINTKSEPLPFGTDGCADSLASLTLDRPPKT